MEWKQPLNTYGPTPSPRRGHTMTVMSSSTLLLFGGESEHDELLNDMYTFDISSSTWRRVVYAHNSPVPSPRYRHTTTAIHPTAVVVIGGETRESSDTPNNNTNNNTSTPTPPLPQSQQQDIDVTNNDNTNSNQHQVDVWLFDLRACTWVKIDFSPNDPNVPSARGGHSALFIKVPGQRPGIYLFGGLGVHDFKSVVHRLCTTDFKWERIDVLTQALSGQQVVVTDPIEHRKNELQQQQSNSTNNNNRTNTNNNINEINNKFKKSTPNSSSTPADCPCPREGHVAVWVPSITSMIIFGGESDEIFHSDFWAFSPVGGRGRAWRWRRLNVSKAGNFAENLVPAVSAASGILLPCATRPLLLIWAGVSSPSSLNLLRHAWVIDLTQLLSLRINVRSIPADAGRVMHSVVLSKSRLLLCGGVDADSDIGCELQVVKLDDSLIGFCSSARDFGPLAAFVSKQGTKDKNMDTDNFTNDHFLTNGNLSMTHRQDVQHRIAAVNTTNRGSVATGNLVPRRPPTLKPGMAFSGHVTIATDFGNHVSVVINGRVHKGMLITCPSVDDDEDDEITEIKPIKPNSATPITTVAKPAVPIKVNGNNGTTGGTIINKNSHNNSNNNNNNNNNATNTSAQTSIQTNHVPQQHSNHTVLPNSINRTPQAHTIINNTNPGLSHTPTIVLNQTVPSPPVSVSVPTPAPVPATTPVSTPAPAPAPAPIPAPAIVARANIPSAQPPQLPQQAQPHQQRTHTKPQLQNQPQSLHHHKQQSQPLQPLRQQAQQHHQQSTAFSSTLGHTTVNQIVPNQAVKRRMNQISTSPLPQQQQQSLLLGQRQRTASLVEDEAASKERAAKRQKRKEIMDALKDPDDIEPSKSKPVPPISSEEVITLD